jgi:hypothetical protein
VITQPHPKPTLMVDFLAMVEAGELVAMDGSRIVPKPCGRCKDSVNLGDTCPASVECPDCHSTAVRCKRPSGHEAASWHKARIEAARAIDDQRQAAGDPTVPAPWPPAVLPKRRAQRPALSGRGRLL